MSCTSVTNRLYLDLKLAVVGFIRSNFNSLRFLLYASDSMCICDNVGYYFLEVSELFLNLATADSKGGLITSIFRRLSRNSRFLFCILAKS
jgi:hypothetical protein